MNNKNEIRGAGGTPGGVGQFIFGLGMVIGGAYLFLERVLEVSSPWQLWGHNAFGLSLILLLIGVGWLFFDGRSMIGWVLTFGGVIIILMGIIANLDRFFSPTNLTSTMLMLGLLAVGLGLVARSLQSS